MATPQVRVQVRVGGSRMPPYGPGESPEPLCHCRLYAWGPPHRVRPPTHLPEAAWRRCVACVAESLAVYHSVPRAVGDLLEAVASAAPQAQPSATLGQALVTH